MNKTFISKTTQLIKQLKKVDKRWSDLWGMLDPLKRECDHRTPDGKLLLKTVRVPKKGSQRAYTHKVCVICGEDVYRDPAYGKQMISVWNSIEIPEANKCWRLEKIIENGSQN